MSTTMLLENEKGQRLLTIEDVAKLPTTLPSGPVHYELYHGVLKIMSPGGFRHGRHIFKFNYYLSIFGEDLGHGITSAPTGLILARDPDLLFEPDAVFIATKSLPETLSHEGWLETIPEIVIEVRSKNDTTPEVHAKAKHYLDAGVEVVWIANPFKQTIEVHRTNQAIATLSGMDLLTAENIIPGFAVPVEKLFAI